MNKAELIDELTKKLDADRKTATEAVELIVDTIVRAVNKGESVTITGFVKNEAGEVVEVHAEYLPDTKSGTPGADSVKVKGNITWVSAAHAVPAQIHLYDRLFADPRPDAGDKDFLTCLNPNSKQTVTAWLEPGTVASPGATWQFERLGYFTVVSKDSTPEAPVLNRIVTLRDSWAQG